MFSMMIVFNTFAAKLTIIYLKDKLFRDFFFFVGKILYFCIKLIKIRREKANETIDFDK